MWEALPSGWMKRWFYHRVASGSGLECTGRPIAFKTAPGLKLDTEDRRRARRLVGITTRFNMRDLAEEYIMYGVVPLASEWRLAVGGLRDDNVRPSICSLPVPSGPRKPRPCASFHSCVLRCV